MSVKKTVIRIEPFFVFFHNRVHKAVGIFVGNASDEICRMRGSYILIPIIRQTANHMSPAALHKSVIPSKRTDVQIQIHTVAFEIGQGETNAFLYIKRLDFAKDPIVIRPVLIEKHIKFRVRSKTLYRHRPTVQIMRFVTGNRIKRHNRPYRLDMNEIALVNQLLCHSCSLKLLKCELISDI